MLDDEDDEDNNSDEDKEYKERSGEYFHDIKSEYDLDQEREELEAFRLADAAMEVRQQEMMSSNNNNEVIVK